MAPRRAHPALVVDTVSDLENLGERIQHHGYTVSWEERSTFEGYERFHCRDGFGNRIEVMTPATRG